jgi:hypothetical protein
VYGNLSSPVPSARAGFPTGLNPTCSLIKLFDSCPLAERQAGQLKNISDFVCIHNFIFEVFFFRRNSGDEVAWVLREYHHTRWKDDKTIKKLLAADFIHFLPLKKEDNIHKARLKDQWAYHSKSVLFDILNVILRDYCHHVQQHQATTISS